MNKENWMTVKMGVGRSFANYCNFGLTVDNKSGILISDEVFVRTKASSSLFEDVFFMPPKRKRRKVVSSFL